MRWFAYIDGLNYHLTLSSLSRVAISGESPYFFLYLCVCKLSSEMVSIWNGEKLLKAHESWNTFQSWQRACKVGTHPLKWCVQAERGEMIRSRYNQRENERFDPDWSGSDLGHFVRDLIPFQWIKYGASWGFDPLVMEQIYAL